MTFCHVLVFKVPGELLVSWPFFDKWANGRSYRLLLGADLLDRITKKSHARLRPAPGGSHLLPKVVTAHPVA